ncbi:MAG: oxidoreductase, partial [Planctomycetota bacterium]
MTLDLSLLFRPLDVRGHTFRNRIVMPPMVVHRGIVSHAGLDWYGERAAGGVALVIVEATSVDRFG